jgi:hypothetical protein
MIPELHRELSGERQRDIVRRMERAECEGRRPTRILLPWLHRHAA